ncbi:glycosyltransferase family 4 protein [Phenylobacterium sp. 58.2.17]|uniref:glycosyltransferase family 4 protein n=1 Tax=Phenylobacterium sp. 58.2.17 TaxID=2969306 RepID=UPI002B25864C|nr:glycosyltransferase family 4 protein [Phenylobacterium sp. 58.2.17]
MARSIALYHPSAGVRPKHNPFGKDVANVELFKAVLRYADVDRVDFLTGAQVSPADLVMGLTPGEVARPQVTTTHLLDLGPAKDAGALVRGVPELTDMAWLRRQVGLENAYSLVGMVHTLAPPAMREMIAKAAVAPMQPWDALICTSPVVQESLVEMFDEWTGYLADRYGGTKQIRPHLPLLPLGVEGSAFAALADRPDVRAATREEMGVGPDDIVVMWVGRLSFFEKAFPQPMFRAAEEAARASGVKVHFALVGWFPDPALHREMYQETVQAYAPSVSVHYLNGNDSDLVGRMWAAGDIFLSLVDNIQETFGITPLEAMAAGMPVVASDWDGYRFTIRDGIDGFLVRSLGGPRGAGQGLLNRHLHMGLTYQAYVGSVAQHTAINVGDAAARIADLIASPELRAKMREAGRRRIRETFDWKVVVAGLQELLTELEAIRLAAQPEELKYTRNPTKTEPYGAFARFATSVLGAGTRVVARPGITLADLERTKTIRLDDYASGARASHDESVAMLTRLIAEGELSVRELVAPFPQNRQQLLGMSIVWMCKLGLLDWR